MTQKYNAHINVEICNTIGAVKYLYKYVYKGSDKVTYSLEAPDKNPQTNSTEASSNLKVNDEIKNYVDARYVSASEACWRTFNYNTNHQSPHTIRLPVHLEDEQNLYFNEKDDLSKIATKNNETPLTHYLELNKTNSDVRDLFYYQMPLKYIWNKKKKLWTPRIR